MAERCIAAKVRLGVICPNVHTDIFKSFLQRLNTTIQANDNSDYLQPYTGFHNIYKTLLEIPDNGTDKWINIEATPKDTLSFARSICLHANSLADKYPGIVIVIFIPASWSIHRQFKHNGESFDLHNYIKASAAQHRFTMQIIEEKTLIWRCAGRILKPLLPTIAGMLGGTLIRAEP